ncbi:MAG: hypothetical protein A3G34_14550 [Candidatus Lindowbacteria bacterium RIFCSPLOWO2_12_FULL_62_27]|nr:MAG: hypothetical protein A3I06_15965 [Candidatus Lindowbacteria bacterium RIFCSPLOWO2_02_FULL_62_12]OGH63083.1 MAG: hypothetical protein A3G34_14550 [Candidatus Lindowbacteria bacterium RIFCSPLOWO2_12_FULL_62_27]
MAEDVQVVRAQLMKKEKMVKDIARTDGRPSYQFLSTVKKELEKEKNAMAAKFYLLFKIAQPFSPGGAGVPTEITRTMHLQLQKVIDDQLKYVNGWLSVSEQKARSQDRGLAPNSSMIKDIIQEYIITKDLLKQKIRGFVLNRRAGVIQTRLDDTVREMKGKGGVEAFAGQTPVEEFLKKQETGIVVELVMEEMAERTRELDRTVNRIVEWRAKVSARPPTPDSSESGLAEQESQGLVRTLIDEITRLREKEKLVGGSESGIINLAEGRAELARLKSIIHEQNLHVGVLGKLIASAIPVEGKAPRQPEEILQNNEAVLNTTDKIETLIKDERNVYMNFRKWEAPPGQFQEEISQAIQLVS